MHTHFMHSPFIENMRTQTVWGVLGRETLFLIVCMSKDDETCSFKLRKM